MRVPPLSSTLAAGSLLAGTLAACAVGEPTGASPVAAGKLAPAVASATRDGQARSFIAQLRRAAGPADLLALRRVGARVTQRYTHLPMVAVTAPGAAAPRLAALPFVTRLSPDLQVRRSLEIAGPAVGANAARRDYGVTGRGVTVAVIDSGIAGSNDLSRSHSDSRSRVVAGYDFVTRTQTLQKNDPCGHGSCVAGIIAGNAYNSSALLSSKQFYGVAPEVNLANLRVLDKNGSGTVANALAAIDWCIRNKAALNIRVINMSLGHAPGESYTTDPLCQASERAWQSGILVVCAAGNRGRKVANDKTSGAAYGTINSPGNDPYVLTVGAVNDFNTQGTGDDEIASFSSRGPSRLDHILKPDLVAPGNRVISIRDRKSLLETVVAPGNLVPITYYLLNLLGLGASSEYYSFSGTSMAAPMASGAAALLFQKDPTLTPDDVKARLMKSAVKVWRADGTTPDIYSRGAGYLNIPRALQCTARVTSPALSPYCTLTNGVVTIHTDQAVWADQALWTDQALWSDQSVSGDQAIWSDQALWTDQAIWSDQALWTDQALWSDQALWADISQVAARGD